MGNGIIANKIYHKETYSRCSRRSKKVENMLPATAISSKPNPISKGNGISEYSLPLLNPSITARQPPSKLKFHPQAVNAPNVSENKGA